VKLLKNDIIKNDYRSIGLQPSGLFDLPIVADRGSWWKNKIMFGVKL
jgi:hypothetical protein